VAPSLPKELDFLHELSFNFLWTWYHDLLELFIRLDPDLWETTHHNPVLMLGTIKQETLTAASRDEAFLAQMEHAAEQFREYMGARSTWFQKTHDGSGRPLIAYFSAEYGLSGCLPIYSGGLGVLAGDHLRSASDLGLPLVGVGLLYQQGYFQQYLNADGWQQERFPNNDFYTLPLRPERGPRGEPLTVVVEYPGRFVYAQIWRAQVGRIPLYLLDTNIPKNKEDDQDITDNLYGGDLEVRIKQEIMLGIGGYRALQALGIQPVVCHMNEGHSAFLALERCRQLMADNGLSFAEAQEAATAGTVFTTHTPVLAGNDHFPPSLVEKYFSEYCRKLGLTKEQFFSLGRQNPHDTQEDFWMTVLALRMAGHSNGVSRLHGKVSRKMWRNVWPGIPEDETPIGSITNDVHAPTWVSRDITGLLTRYLGPRWREAPGDYALWGRIHNIPDEELWRTHERRRERLVAYARQRLRMQLTARGAPPTEVAQADEILNPEALTIGFARRFATYKRATLLLRHPERLLGILNQKDCPVQIIFAGKAHPQDNTGKELIREVIHFERRPDARQRMVFLEDYDMVITRYLVQGVDVWLNTPRRRQEASGTSGMKAAVNGALNLSILDGWWDEAYDPATGWAIGRGEEYGNDDYQDEVESNALYDLLEKEVVPLFFNRGADGLPRGWLQKMKNSMRALGPQFGSKRMLREYTEELYLPCEQRYQSLSGENFKRAKALAAWKARLRERWPGIKILDCKGDARDDFKVGETLTVRVSVDLHDLTPDDVSVELYCGSIDARGEIQSPRIVPMSACGGPGGTVYEFSGGIQAHTSGRHGYTIRVLPRADDLDNPRRMGLILWK
jgi:starch phosphorylase